MLYDKEIYSDCQSCNKKEVKGLEIYCTKFNKPLIIGQLNSWESDYYQLPECIKDKKT